MALGPRSRQNSMPSASVFHTLVFFIPESLGPCFNIAWQAMIRTYIKASQHLPPFRRHLLSRHSVSDDGASGVHSYWWECYCIHGSENVVVWLKDMNTLELFHLQQKMIWLRSALVIFIGKRYNKNIILRSNIEWNKWRVSPKKERKKIVKHDVNSSHCFLLICQLGSCAKCFDRYFRLCDKPVANIFLSWQKWNIYFNLYMWLSSSPPLEPSYKIFFIHHSIPNSSLQHYRVGVKHASNRWGRSHKCPWIFFSTFINVTFSSAT